MYTPEITEVDVETMKASLDNINSKSTKQNELTQQIIDILSHRLKAKAIFRKIDYETLCYVRESLDIVIEKKIKEASEKEEKDRIIKDTIVEIKEKLNERNLSVNDLFPNGFDSLSEKKPRKHKKRSILYKFHYHIFGKDYYWSGKGYLPRTLRCHLSKGHTLESCYMDQENWFTSDEAYSQKVPEIFQKDFIALMNNAERMDIPRKMKDCENSFMI